ncbi:MAG TPA: polysaccharide biosynthesis/export family protein [Verrucomicrobiae bacterium]|nr:polysaccharide biosynthesis/export family protein [Verrucomicrobiae bacterium]
MRNKILSIISFVLFLILPAPLSAQSQPMRPQAPQTAASSGQITPPEAGTSVAPELHRRNPRYRIQPDDVLDLSFRYTPEFDQEVTVEPDGFIQLKGLEEGVLVKGQTVPQLVATLQHSYANVLNDPVISVVLSDFERPYFIVGGQVTKPGKYDLRGPTTASQAVSIAGGFTDYPKNTKVILFRRYSDDEVETRVLNLKKILKGKEPNEDVQLQPGDMLYVPKSLMGKLDRFLPRSTLGTYFAPGQW